MPLPCSQESWILLVSVPVDGPQGDWLCGGEAGAPPHSLGKWASCPWLWGMGFFSVFAGRGRDGLPHKLQICRVSWEEGKVPTGACLVSRGWAGGVLCTIHACSSPLAPLQPLNSL